MTAEPTVPMCPVHGDQAISRRCTRCSAALCDVCLGVTTDPDRCPRCGTTIAAAGSSAVVHAPPGDAGAERVDAGPQMGRRADDAPPDLAVPATPATSAWRSAPVTFTLLTIYVIVFVIDLLLGSTAPLTLLGAQINELVLAGQWWRVLSATMLHAGLAHLAFNGYALYILGPQLERGVGSAAFATLYLASGLAGGLAFLVGAPEQSAVGASGAIFGLFGAYVAAAWTNRDTPAGRAGLSQLGILLAINLALPLVVPGIAWQAHLGGLVAGIVIGLSWADRTRRGQPRGAGAHLAAVPTVIAVGLLAGLLWYT